MEGARRPRQLAPQVTRTFAPTRLQDDWLAAVYDRLLDIAFRREGTQQESKEVRVKRRCVEHGLAAGAGGRHG